MCRHGWIQDTVWSDVRGQICIVVVFGSLSGFVWHNDKCGLLVILFDACKLYRVDMHAMVKDDQDCIATIYDVYTMSRVRWRWKKKNRKNAQ